jgi:ectoine hydroxylase-related dioxygenase (phytanoyl-CoA dioxygenase family)
VSLLGDWEERGFAVVRGLVLGDELAQMRAAFERLVHRAHSLQGTADLDGSRFVVESEPFRLHRVIWAGGAEPALAALGADPRWTRLAAEALRSRALVQLIQQAHFKLPGDEVGFAWHQDASNRRQGTPLWTDLDGRGSFVEIALAIDASGPDNGGLSFLPGSHRLGFVADPETGALPEGLVDPGQAVTPVLEPGDAVVFGPFVIHGSAPNRSDGPRRMFLQGYALPGANRREYPGCGLGVPREAP